MKSSTLFWITIVAVLAFGAWYFLAGSINPAMNTPSPDTNLPPGAAGIRGSADQGNMGAPDSGTAQEPMADGAEGSIIGNNLALGTDGNQKMGTYLIAYNGMTLYTTSKDAGPASACYDDCAKNWPPYLVGPEDNVQNIKAGVSGRVGTFVRADGGIQVTYNEKPLYFYASDTQSGDVKGEGLGGVWHVVKP